MLTFDITLQRKLTTLCYHLTLFFVSGWYKEKESALTPKHLLYREGQLFRWQWYYLQWWVLWITFYLHIAYIYKVVVRLDKIPNDCCRKPATQHCSRWWSQSHPKENDETIKILCQEEGTKHQHWQIYKEDTTEQDSDKKDLCSQIKVEATLIQIIEISMTIPLEMKYTLHARSKVASLERKVTTDKRREPEVAASCDTLPEEQTLEEDESVWASLGSAKCSMCGSLYRARSFIVASSHLFQMFISFCTLCFCLFYGPWLVPYIPSRIFFLLLNWFALG